MLLLLPLLLLLLPLMLLLLMPLPLPPPLLLLLPLPLLPKQRWTRRASRPQGQLLGERRRLGLLFERRRLGLLFECRRLGLLFGRRLGLPRAGQLFSKLLTQRGAQCLQEGLDPLLAKRVAVPNARAQLITPAWERAGARAGAKAGAKAGVRAEALRARAGGIRHEKTKAHTESGAMGDATTKTTAERARTAALNGSGTDGKTVETTAETRVETRAETRVETRGETRVGVRAETATEVKTAGVAGVAKAVGVTAGGAVATHQPSPAGARATRSRAAPTEHRARSASKNKNRISSTSWRSCARFTASAGKVHTRSTTT